MRINSGRTRVPCYIAFICAGIMMMAANSAAVAADECQHWYTVARGDTLARIAQRFGTSIHAVQTRNHIQHMDRIYVGQRLCIPGERMPMDVRNTDVTAIQALTNLNVRSGPSTNFAVIGWLTNGDTAAVTGLSHDGAWWRIACPSSARRNCWVSAHSRYTRPIRETPRPPDQMRPTHVTAVVVMTDQATLYAGPGEAYAVVGFMFGGMPIPVNGISMDGRWWHAHCPDAPDPTSCDYWISAHSSITQPTELP